MVRSIHIAFVLLLAFASVIAAQTPLATCTALDIDGPSEVDPGAPLVFKAKLSGTIQTSRPVFNWTVSAGTIASGQGTEEIVVDSTGLGGIEIIATVELSGSPAGCKGSSRTTRVKVPPIACGIAFDSYGDISFEDEKARLDNFAIQLWNNPASGGIILMTAGQVTFKNESLERLARAKSYLARVRSIDPARIATLDCGFTQELSLHFWVVAPGIISPSCDIFTTIPLSDVKFTKRRPKSSKRRP